MAVSLFKLVMSATTTTLSKPTIKRYQYKYRTAQRSGVRIVISSNRFFNDAGQSMGTTKLTPISSSNGYYLLLVNGVLQQSGLYTVGATGSNVIINSGAQGLQVSAPITLVVNNFAPASTTTVST
ncbi:MAG: DUF4183 domain-containing protein [Ruminiclostridium sp.]|nr:DUF4183 domain-containing protein [Ruminiclostridium sp.]